MNNTALALVAHPPTSPSLDHVILRELGGDDVLIRTSLSGFSTGTDRWVMTGRFEWGGFSFPLITGYQLTGIVEAIGDEVTQFSVGQAVCAIVATDTQGITSAWGCHASAVVSSSENVYDAVGVPEVSAAFLVSAQVGYNAASRVAAQAGDDVWVIGDGIIGASAAMAAAARGFRVLILGRHAERLSPFAETAIATLHSRDHDDDVLTTWSPRAVIDTVQNDEAFATYVDALEPAMGQIVYSGHSPDGIRHWADMAALQQRELRVDFVAGWTRHRLVATLEAMRSGAIDLGPFASTIARDRASATSLADEVASGTLSSTAAAIDWRLVS